MASFKDLFSSAWRYFETDGVPASGPHKPSKSEIAAIGSALDTQINTAAAGFTTVANTAARDTFYADPANQSKLVYVNNNNGSASDPANGVYEYVSGAPRIAQGYYNGVAAVVEPLVDEATTAATTSATLVDNAYSIQQELGRGPLQPNLFDARRSTPNQSIASNGTVGPNTGFTLSDMMRVAPSQSYFVSAIGVVTYRWLDGTGAYVAGSYGTIASGGGAITSPATARFLQISTPTNSLRRLMVVIGTSAPATYEAPGFYDPMTSRQLMQSSAQNAIAAVFSTSINLFDQTRATDDYGMGSTGAPYSNPGNNSSVTDFIPVVAGASYVSNQATSANAAAFYDADQLYLSSATIVSGTAFTAPAGASYFRQQFATTGKATMMVVRASALPATYIGTPVIEAGLQKRNSTKVQRKGMDAASRAPRNLFNPADTIDGFAISNTGVLYASAGRYTTGFIEVTEGVPHISNYGSQSTFVCYYDENFNILNSGTNYSITANTAFIPPTGAYWMRRTVNTASGSIGYDSRSDLYMYAGAYATGTVAFGSGNAAPGDTVTIGTNTITFVASGATGAQVNIGAANYNTAANLLAYISANSATLGVTAALSTSPNTVRLSSTAIGPAANIALSKSGANVVVSGTTLTGAQPVSLNLNRFGTGSGSQPQMWAGKSAYVHGDSQVNNGYWQPRAASITGLAITYQGTPGRGMNDAATDIASVDLSAYDLIINDHMTNDLNRDSVLGTIADDRTVASFYGNMERWLYNVLSRYPTKRVLFFGAAGRTDMTTNPGGHTLQNYDDAMRAFCAKWSIPFFDLLANAGFNPLNYTAGSSTWTTDGLHYNAAGGDIVGRLKGNFINQHA